MGHVTRKPRHQEKLEIETAYESVDVQILDEGEVLKCLEPEQPHENELRPATGLIYGLAFGTIFWVIIIAASSLAIKI